MAFKLGIIVKILLPDRWNLELGRTKLFACENVTTGCIHELTTKTLTKNGTCSVKCIHTSPCDTGYGAARRFRGWMLGTIYCILSYFAGGVWHEVWSVGVDIQVWSYADIEFKTF